MNNEVVNPVLDRINMYLTEDRANQRESKRLKSDDPELSKQMFQQHIERRKHVKKMSQEVYDFVTVFLERWVEI